MTACTTAACCRMHAIACTHAAAHARMHGMHQRRAPEGCSMPHCLRCAVLRLLHAQCQAALSCLGPAVVALLSGGYPFWKPLLWREARRAALQCRARPLAYARMTTLQPLRTVKPRNILRPSEPESMFRFASFCGGVCCVRQGPPKLLVTLLAGRSSGSIQCIDRLSFFCICIKPQPRKRARPACSTA